MSLQFICNDYENRPIEIEHMLCRVLRLIQSTRNVPEALRPAFTSGSRKIALPELVQAHWASSDAYLVLNGLTCSRPDFLQT